jgi:hypothetical protein
MRRLLGQQSKELPFRLSQQQQPRQPQQQYRFSCELCVPQHSSNARDGWSELADGNLSGVPKKSPEPTPVMPLEVSENQPESVTLVGQPKT